MAKKIKTRRSIHHRRIRMTANNEHRADAQVQKRTTEAAIGLIEVALEYLKDAVQSE